VFHGPSICTKTNWWPTQADENNFMAHPYFLRPILAVTLWPVPKMESLNHEIESLNHRVNLWIIRWNHWIMRLNHWVIQYLRTKTLNVWYVTHSHPYCFHMSSVSASYVRMERLTARRVVWSSHQKWTNKRPSRLDRTWPSTNDSGSQRGLWTFYIER
jgi:hypothetical protein